MKSILSAIVHVLERIFTPGTITVAASIVDIVLPQFTALTNAAAQAIITAETAAIAAGKQSGSGEQKAALVVAAIEAQYESFAKANGIPVIPENIKKYVDAIVAALNSFPAPTVPPTA